MKIDRRSFLSLVAGGAAGTALSPLPWKLTDDISIWSQNWSWTPVPEDGEAEYVSSVCTLCPGGCGITARRIKDRVVKIEGLKGCPVNDGGICILGLSGTQLLYGPTRIQSPMKRTGNRGDGQWEKISWDEAVSTVVEKLASLRSGGQPQKAGCILGSEQGTLPSLFDRFMTAYGSPNVMSPASSRTSYEMAMQLMQGGKPTAGYDFEHSDFILSFGSGIIDGWGSPVRMFQSNSDWKTRKVKVVQIEPRLSNTAAKSDKWIPVNPGTECVLALGMAYVIIKEGIYNQKFIDNFAYGFFDWTDEKGENHHKGFKELVLGNYSPDQVSKITGVSQSTIAHLARSFAFASKPVAICGRGQGHTPVSLHEAMAVHALNALVGNINQKGGIWAVPAPDYIRWPEVKLDEAARKGLTASRIDGAGSDKYPLVKSLLNRLPGAIASGSQSLELLFVSGVNPLYEMRDTHAVKSAFEKIPFVVSFSSYMDETAANADLILPSHVYLERYEDVPSPVGFNRPFIGLTKPVIEPLYDTRHVGDVILLMAKALGGSVAEAFPWDSYEGCLRETLGDKWDLLVENGFWIDEGYVPESLDKAFETKSTKFEFFVSRLSETLRKDEQALPHYMAIESEGDVESYPLVLIPYDTTRLSNGYIGNPPFMTKTLDDTILKGNDGFIEINPKTAKTLGWVEGAFATVTTPKGEARVKVHLFEGLMPGIIAMPTGLGHTAYDSYLAGKGFNVNELIGPVEDPASGLDAAWGIRAKLAKA